MINEDILKYLPPDMLAAYKKVETLKNYHEIMKRISKGLSSEQTEEEFTKERRAEDQNFNNIKNMEESETMIDYKKKYEEALERCKKEFNYSNLPFPRIKQKLELVFPELKESEDEKIRKELIRAFTVTADKRDYEIYGNGITYKQVLAWLEKQGEMKSQGKSALEVWKDMRLEVYQQASGNRHEPNYSDDSTKMFSLTDIDEIFEKIAEKQGEQKTTNNIEPKFKKE